MNISSYRVRRIICDVYSRYSPVYNHRETRTEESYVQEVKSHRREYFLIIPLYAEKFHKM